MNISEALKTLDSVSHDYGYGEKTGLELYKAVLAFLSAVAEQTPNGTLANECLEMARAVWSDNGTAATQLLLKASDALIEAEIDYTVLESKLKAAEQSCDAASEKIIEQAKRINDLEADLLDLEFCENLAQAGLKTVLEPLLRGKFSAVDLDDMTLRLKFESEDDVRAALKVVLNHER